MSNNIAIWISAISTFLIAVFTIVLCFLSYQMKRANDQRDKQDEKFKKQIKDLYKAIVISNLPCAGDSVDNKLKDFKRYFKDRDNFFDT